MSFGFRSSIFTAASPNTQSDDAFLAFTTLLSFWSWRNENFDSEFKNELESYLKVPYVSLVDSGRSALMTIVKSLNLEIGDEVILPSFTCVVVADAVLWANGKGVYLDTKKEDLNADYENIKSFITEKTKAIVVQHTFGKRVNVQDIRRQISEIRREDIILIEDFAHVIQRDVKLEGDFGFLTFGIEKVISSVRGGAIITKEKSNFDAIENIVKSYPEFPKKYVFRSLMNPIFWYFAIPLHSVGIGRFSVGAFIRGIWRKLGFLGIMVEHKENHAIKPNWFPAKMSPALSKLGLKQLRKLDYYNEHRKRIAAIYDRHLAKFSDSFLEEGAERSEAEGVTDSQLISPGLRPPSPELERDQNRIYLRYPLIVKDEKDWIKVWNKARSLRVTLGNWFAVPLYGNAVNDETYKKLNYDKSKTPETLSKCKRVLNLPTSVNISEKRAEELAREIAKILK